MGVHCIPESGKARACPMGIRRARAFQVGHTYAVHGNECRVDLAMLKYEGSPAKTKYGKYARIHELMKNFLVMAERF